MSDDAETERYPVNRKPHPVEWIIGAASALGLVALIGYLAITALSETDGPPIFETVVDEVLAADGAWHVRVTLRNAGDKTAADVTLKGTASDGEESDVTFDYVPAGSTRKGALLFDAEPSGLELSVRSYTAP